VENIWASLLAFWGRAVFTKAQEFSAVADFERRRAHDSNTLGRRADRRASQRGRCAYRRDTPVCPAYSRASLVDRRIGLRDSLARPS